jgi:ribosomal-protein-alanine N-acetyltransferase
MIKDAILANSKELFTLESSIFFKNDFGLSLSSFYYHIKKNKLYIYVDNNKIIGYILWLKRKSYFRLYSICVSEAYRGKGIAQELLSYSFESLQSKKYTLEVKTTNNNAIKIYMKNGFSISKILANYYPNNVDGYLMIKE